MRSTMQRTTPAALAAAMVVGFGPAADAHTEQTVAGPLGRQIDAYLTRLVPFGFSGVVLIERDGGIVVGKGYGSAIDERGLPNTLDTVHTIDSISKHFTAVAILRLEMQGRLTTDDRLDRFFDDLPPDKRAITLHQLLTHTSGVTTGTTEYIADWTREGVLEAVFDRPVRFAPGEQFEYSNLGYATLAAVVEEAGGKPFDEFLRDELLLPAGMDSTGRRIEASADCVVAHRYIAGVDTGSPGDRPNPDWNHVGAGGLLTTAPDMLRWHHALEGDAILSADARAKLYTPHGGRRYGYGLVVESTDSGRLLHHNGGSSKGSASEFRRFLDADVTVIAMCNKDGEDMLLGNQLMKHVEHMIFGGEVRLPPVVHRTDESELLDLAGTYRIDETAVVDVDVESGMLAVRVRGQAAVDAVLGLDGTNGYRDTNDQVEEILSGRRGRLAETALGPRISGYIDDRRTETEGTLGPFTGYAVLGTTPDWRAFGDRMTFVEMRFERGTLLCRLHWRDGRVEGLGGEGIPEPAMAWFLPEADDDGWFAGYHIPTGRGSRLRFERNPAGAVSGLAFADGTTARRR